MRGGFNQTHGAVMGGHAVKHAIQRAGLEAGDVEDVYMGCGFPEGATGNNIARESAIWADARSAPPASRSTAIAPAD